MSNIDFNLLMTLMMLFFGYGLMFGCMLAERRDPNSPQPTNYSKKLQDRWVKGFKDGEKSMARRMSQKLDDERILREYYDSKKENP